MIYILLLLLVIIFLQDFKDRQVYVFLFLLSAILGGSIYYFKTVLAIFLINIIFNLIFTLFLFFILKLYSKFKLKKNVYEAIGLGDFFFFIVLAVSFPTISFLVLFSVSLIFSLILFMVLKPILKIKTVPLAGFQALFLILVFCLNLLLDITNLYMF